MVAKGVMIFLATLLGASLLDKAVRPRHPRRRRWQGLVILVLATSALFGLILAIAGSVAVAGVVTVAFAALLMATSNAKYMMLGEPLLFSDLALLAAVFRHPRFYLTAISVRERAILAIGAPILLGALAWLFVPDPMPHIVGLALGLSAATVLVVLLASPAFRMLATAPDIERDHARFGLVATLILYWLRWRGTPDPAPCGALDAEEGGEEPSPELIVIVQCESFADPVELTGDAGLALPGLERARASAWQYGDLGVSGFGAYTMRTEYGVLFGRSEAALGFRRYDPFLTADGETSYALSSRLAAWGYHGLFVHPHDMRFYGRDLLMPAIGFDRLIGEESFDQTSPRDGRYVDDRTLGVSIGELIDTATGPTLMYVVTMENHGPWDRDRKTGSRGGLDAYLRHLRSSDAMLDALVERLRGAGRSALLVFFGDHRPSIPGVTAPGGDRHTPYVMVRFAADGRILGGADARADLSPDSLHHAILCCVQSGGRPPRADLDLSSA